MNPTLKQIAIALLLVTPLPFLACCATQPPRELVQYAPIGGLMNGVMDGQATFGWLKTQGDFGLGTFSGLDGEMIELDGCVYQIKSDGHAYPVADKQTLPFAVVTFFHPDYTLKLPASTTFVNLPQVTEAALPSRNLFYAFEIKGKFKSVRTRSVGAQSKPYPKLIDAVKTQSTFDFKNVEGTMVGFWCPSLVGGLNVPGFHLHFLTKDKTAGGHVLAFSTDDATLTRETLDGLHLILPQDQAFLKADLSGVKEQDIHAAEQERGKGK